MESFLHNRITQKYIRFASELWNQLSLKPQNDRLNFSFVKDIHAVGEKMARNGRKTAICQ